MRAAGELWAAALGFGDSKTLIAAVVVALIATAACRSSHDSPTAPSLPPPPPTTGLQCGVERWAVKTLSDADALRVDLKAVRASSVSALTSLPAQCGGGPDRRVYPEEFVVYEVDAVIQAVKNEDDRDRHFILQDLATPGDTLIAELPDTACMGAAQSPYVATLAQAFIDFMNLFPPGSTNLSTLVGKRVRVRGVGFFDFPHGQTGRARSCVELHPVIGIQSLTP